MRSTDESPRLPPGPEETHTIDVTPETLETLNTLQHQYGNMVSIMAPDGRRTIFVNEPDEVRRILVRRHSKYGKGRGFKRVEMLLGNGLIVSDGDVWRRARTMIQPAFSKKNVHRLIELMVQCCEHRSQHWIQVSEAGGTLNITKEMSEFALELILRSIFGRDYDTHIDQGDENPFAFLSQESARDLGVVIKVRNLREVLRGLINHRKEVGPYEEYDFLSMYIGARDKAGEPFTDRELIDELITLIVAGYETSAGTLNWAWYLLAANPEVEAKLHAEAQRVLPDGTEVTLEKINELGYTMSVLEETLRLYPPVWIYSRRSLQEDDLTDFDVPPDADIFLSPFILHRTEAFWPDPDRFDPDRFGPDSPHKKGDRPYFPFSLGPRRCLGEYFSFLEMKIHLAMLIQRFSMTSITESFPGLDLGINLRSLNEIELQPTKRI